MTRADNQLLSIAALARAGATEYAWQKFQEAGLDQKSDNPAVLTLCGRLLKDRAATAKGKEQRRYCREAAQAYARAGELTDDSYPWINAATLWLLAHEPAKAQKIAEQVLRKTGEDGETPYWQAATRAEALLVLNRQGEAGAGLRKAIAAAPLAFEDHATTLRQFERILGALRKPADWLDQFRPPRSVHFAGPMTLTNRSAVELSVRTLAIAREERVGFAYGAIAAGADIVMAEALLERGIELHLLLPLPPTLFRQHSVVNLGRQWGGRYDRLLKAASSLRIIDASATVVSSLSIHLAATIAMGSALMHARQLQSEAVQLIASPQARSGRSRSNTASILKLWQRGGRRVRIIPVETSGVKTQKVIQRSPDTVIAATLRFESVRDDAELRSLADHLSRGPRPLIGPIWTGDAVLASFKSAEDAARAAWRSNKQNEIRVAGHFGLARRIKDPFSKGIRLVGQPAELAKRAMLSVPPKAFHVTQDFAATLVAENSTGWHFEPVGEMAGAGEQTVSLFSIRPCKTQKQPLR